MRYINSILTWCTSVCLYRAILNRSLGVPAFCCDFLSCSNADCRTANRHFRTITKHPVAHRSDASVTPVVFKRAVGPVLKASRLHITRFRLYSLVRFRVHSKVSSNQHTGELRVLRILGDLRIVFILVFLNETLFFVNKTVKL